MLTRVELPLAVPLIVAGVRTAAVQVVATATLAALVGGGGLGRIINTGFGQQDYGQIVAGGILVAGLALLTEVRAGRGAAVVTPGPPRALRCAPGGPVRRGDGAARRPGCRAWTGRERDDAVTVS